MGRSRSLGRRAAAVVALAAMSLGCQDDPVLGQSWLSDSDQAADLAQLQAWIDLERSFAPEARGQAIDRVAELLSSGPVGSEPEFYLEVARVMALADNGHSNLTTAPIHQRFGLVPVRIYWFTDGPHIVRARTAYRELLGATLDSVAGISVDELVTRLSLFHGGTSDHFRQYFAGAYFLSPALLFAAGISDRRDRLGLSLTLPDGRREQTELHADSGPDSPSPGRPWRRLIPDPLPSEGGDWVGYQPPGRLLALQSEGDVFRYELLSQNATAYIQLRLNIGSGGTSVRDFVASARERIAKDQPRAIILDNRFNPGGDLTRTAEFALDLPSMVPENGKVYVLTSNATFSAGIYTSFYPKAAAPDKTLVVGERVGDRERFWAETGRPFTLSNSGYRLSYSLQVHDLKMGCREPDVCHMARHPDRWNIAVGTLDPDVAVGFSFDDYQTGRDPALDHVLGLIGQT